MCLVIPISLFSGEVNEAKFHYLIDQEIKICQESERLFSFLDPSDAYSRYFISGMILGLQTAKHTFDSCCECNSGWGCEKALYTLPILEK
jgi:hypothetical protein